MSHTNKEIVRVDNYSYAYTEKQGAIIAAEDFSLDYICKFVEVPE